MFVNNALKTGKYSYGLQKMNLSMGWFELLNLAAAIITVIGALNIFFRKSLGKYNQIISSFNKGLRLKRIENLRRQYFWISSIEKDHTLLVSFVGRQILAGLVITVTMLFIGFIFLYLDKGFFKLFGGVYLLLLYGIFIKHIGEYHGCFGWFKQSRNF